MTKEELLEEVKDANKKRAALIYYIFAELQDEFGTEKAAELMKKAIYKFGTDKTNQNYPDETKQNLKTAAETFCKSTDVKEYLFNPNIVEMKSNNNVIINMIRCPLVEKWKEMNLSENMISLLCEIAHAVDYGTWEGALKYNLTFHKTLGNSDDECLLEIVSENKSK